MARPLRLEYAGTLYHLPARGNARADIFADDDDRHLFLELLGKEITQQDRRCYAYCLMGNPIKDSARDESKPAVCGVAGTPCQAQGQETAPYAASV